MTFDEEPYMASTFMRFQEFFESPKFRGEVFTRKEFVDWYIEKFGAFTYTTDWTGFNLPSRIFDKFREGAFDPLTDHEAALLDTVSQLPQPSYVIAVGKQDGMPVNLNTLRHEIAHGLYATCPEYRAEVLMILEGCQLAPVIRFLMGTGGYHWASFFDECHAYLSADFDYLVSVEGVPIEHMRDIHDGLRGAFDHYTDGKFREDAR